MIKMQLTKDMISRAKIRDAEMPNLKNSIREQKGRLDGFIAEEALAFHTKSKLVSAVGSDKYDFDLVIQGIKVEVKTQSNAYIPKRDYFSTVSDFSSGQKPEKYAFVTIVHDNKELTNPVAAYLKGFMDYSEFKEKSEFIPKGSVTGHNNFVSKADQWNIINYQLKSFDNSRYLN